MNEACQHFRTTETPFRVVRGLEKNISNELHEGYVYFTTDTKKIFLDTAEQRLSMGGNTGIHYGDAVFEEVDTDQPTFIFKIDEIQGNEDKTQPPILIPNPNDLILNTDGCFYRVENLTGENWNITITTTKLTIAGSGGGGTGGTTISLLITDENNSFSKHFTQDTKEAKIKFTVNQKRGPEDNAIASVQYKIGNIDEVTQNEEYEMGHKFEFDLLPYISRMSTSNSTVVTVIVTDVYGTRKSATYYVNIVALSLTSEIQNNILMTTTGLYEYQCKPIGGTTLDRRQVIFEYYNQYNTLLKTETVDVRNSNTTIFYNLDFIKQPEDDKTENLGLGVYSIKVYYIGYIPGTDIRVPSNILEYRTVYYSEEPMLVSYLTKYVTEQFSTLSIEYMIAANIQTDEEVKVNLIVSGSGMEDKVVQRKTTYNSLKVWNIYFDTVGTYNLTIEIDGTSESIRYEGIQVVPYENTGIPVIDPSRCDLYLSATNRSNDEVNKEVWEFQKNNASDLITTNFEGFAWGDTNGWLSKVIDAEKGQLVDFLRLSSNAKATINFEPFKQVMVNNNLSDAMGTGLTIELDFMLSGVTDFTKPLISCLSYIDPDAVDKEIQVGFQITGQESTFNTQNITATGASILEGDDSEIQAYNTKIQGLTTKFIENERIHLTWVVERKSNKFPMIRTYLNGIKSGITQYGDYNKETNQVVVSDSLQQNPNDPAKIIFDSTYGIIDVYNVRVYQQALEDIDILNNYIATLDTPEQRANCYEDNILLQNGIIDFKTITNGTYKLSVPYITITGGESLTKPKDDQPFGGQYYINTADTTSHLPFSKKDYRLIRHFEFVDQSGKHPNREYFSTFSEKQDQGLTREILNGLVMYGQGTSSMEYPVKNLRIKWKMKDENGNKVKFTVNADDCPVDLVCCKADYMESSGSHNTGTANLIYELLDDVNLTTPAQQWYDSKVDYSIVTTIRGYPVLIFYRPTEDDDYEFVGKYNLNLDKATSEPFGFFPEPEDKPAEITTSTFGWGEENNEIVETIHCYEFLNNADALTNFTTPTETYGYLQNGQYVQAQTYEEICKSNYRLVDGAWQEVKNEDGKHCPLWFNSYESRYPEGEADDGSDINIDSFLRLCSWINSTDTTGLTGAARKEKIDRFKNEASEYLNIKFTTFYYILTHLLLMIDSRAKNMMIATWDNKIWYPIFYDMDTMLGLNNYGYNKFNYDIEDTDANVYNGQNSVLWNNFREAFPNEIRDMYNQLQQNSKLNYEGILSVYGELQADAVNEAIYNADSYYKYIRPFSEGYYNSVTGDLDWVSPGTKDYLYASQGSRSMHRKWWVQNRLNYLNGKYLSDNFKADRYIMRLYTPEANEVNYIEVGQITENEFIQGEFYIRILVENEDGTTSYKYDKATVYDSNEFYFKIDSNKINESIATIMPNNNFILTPLYNQYLAVAYGGSNGTTVGPKKGMANQPVHITTQQNFNDTETYIYGGSNLKDLGDLSPQYLGAFKFPDKTTKLEKLTLGNLNNKYYNPNFSSLTIGNSAPYLSELNISNCIGLSRQNLNLFSCNNLTKVLATGTGLTGITFAEHGILEELRLPSTLRSLKLIDQPYLTNGQFTIGTYDSDRGVYSSNDYSKLLHICLNDVPNINTYQMVLDLENSKAFQSYCFKNVNWKIQNANELTNNSIKVLDILKDKQTFSDFVGTPPLTGVLTFSREATQSFAASTLLTLYKKYIKIYPELYFNFEDTNKVNTVKIVAYDDSIEWENKIITGKKITEEFLKENGPKNPYVLSESIKGNKYTYNFQGKWHIIKQEDWDKYINGEITKEQLISNSLSTFNDQKQKPISDYIISQNVVIVPEYKQDLNTYIIKFYNGDGSLMEQKVVDYGVEIKDVYPQETFPYKLEQSDEHFDLYEGYNFIGYGFSARDTVPIDGGTPITSNSNYYALFNKVTDLRKATLHYEDFYNFEEILHPDGNGERCYKLSPKYQEMYGKIVIPTSYNNKKVVTISGFSDATTSTSIQKISHIFFENNQNIYLIGQNCFKNMRSLQYFEFIDSIHKLGPESLVRCGLSSELYNDNLMLPASLEHIERSALNECFNASGYSNNIRDLMIQIPSGTKTIGKFGIAHLYNVKVTIKIGDETNLSILKLSNEQTFNSNNSYGTEDITDIIFYTTTYKYSDFENTNYFGPYIKNISILP